MTLGPRALLAGAAACAFAFAVMLALAYGSGEARWLDATALQGFVGIHGSSAGALTTRIMHLGDPAATGIVGALLCLVALARGRPRAALFVLALLALSSVASQGLKAVLAYPRYDGGARDLIIGPKAFPSGHATAAMSIAIALVVVAPSRWRPLATLAGALVALGVGFSVIADGGHFPSDVMGGFLLATGLALVLLAGVRVAASRFPEPDERRSFGPFARSKGARVAAPGVLGVAIGAAAIVAMLALVKLPEVILYAQAHTVFTFVAGALTVCALVLLAGVTGVLPRRG